MLRRVMQRGGEFWAHNEFEKKPDYDDDIMYRVSRIVADMPSGPRRAVMATYCWHPGQTADYRASKLRVHRATYYRHLAEAHEIIEAGVVWRDVLVA